MLIIRKKTCAVKTGITTSPVALVASSTPCLGVWVGAPVDSAGAATNTAPVMTGESEAQYRPVVMSNFEGFFIPIDDANKVMLKSLNGTQTLNYEIWF